MTKWKYRHRRASHTDTLSTLLPRKDLHVLHLFSFSLDHMGFPLLLLRRIASLVSHQHAKTVKVEE